MSPLASNQAARRVVRSCFGSPLSQQERGFYVCLELLAVLRGHQMAGVELLAPGPTMQPFVRVSHDFARRLAVDALRTTDLGYDAIDAAAMGPLHSLLQSVALRVPGQRKLPDWFGTHLYPYVGELIHYDAARARGSGKPALERYVFRGAGVLAHEMLRHDPDPARLEVVRAGLGRLVGDSGSSLGRLANALHSHDFARDDKPWSGDVEDAINYGSDATKWPEIFRSGVANIVSRSEVPSAQRVEHLMHWVPYCLARHALALAHARLGDREPPIVVDLRPATNPLRVTSRRDLEAARWAVVSALQLEAERTRDDLDVDDPDRAAYDALLETRERLVKGPRAFVMETLAAVGALNATTGRRWFTLHLPMLEAIVHAVLQGPQEVELDRFLGDHLYGVLDLVVDGRSAAHCGLASEIDLAEFDVNAEYAARALRGLGLLVEYSDSTRMVGAGVHR